MGTKVTYIRLPEPGTGNIKGVGKSLSREFWVGTACLGEWGGGIIASMEVDRSIQSVVIRKSTPFTSPVAGSVGKSQCFDAICIPLASLSQFTIVDDKEEQPAKPTQQQGQQPNNQRRS